jgi:hypothetical protein
MPVAVHPACCFLLLASFPDLQELTLPSEQNPTRRRHRPVKMPVFGRFIAEASMASF